jgi:Holliday junction resolvase RusA-like endonuclease
LVEKEEKGSPWAFNAGSPGYLIDNLVKSFCDSLTSEDKYIANITATKRWVDFDTGWIECRLVDEPMQILIEPPVKG